MKFIHTGYCSSHHKQAKTHLACGNLRKTDPKHMKAHRLYKGLLYPERSKPRRVFDGSPVCPKTDENASLIKVCYILKGRKALERISVQTSREDGFPKGLARVVHFLLCNLK